MMQPFYDAWNVVVVQEVEDWARRISRKRVIIMEFQLFDIIV